MVMKHYGVLGVAGVVCLLAAISAYSQQQGGGQTGQQGGRGQQTQGQSGQNNGQAQPAGSVTGQVVSSTTGEPLRKVSLTLQPQGGRGGSPAAASSDNSGNFRFVNVAPGTYTLTGERSGFVRGSYGEDRPGQQGRQIQVTSGQAAGGIQLKLQPHSVIVGRVYDIDGDPVQGAQVQAMRYSYPRGQKQLTNAAQAATNDLGEYRIAGLPPGRYYVSASDRGILSNLRGAIQEIVVQATEPGGPGGRGGRGAVLDQVLNSRNNVDPEAYVTTYYPRTTDASGATAIELVPGSEMRGIDIGLLKGRTYTVSGVIEGIDQAAAALNQLNIQQNKQNGKGKAKGGGFPGGIQADLVPRNGNGNAFGGRAGLGGFVQVSPDGTFQARGVRPGSYYLMAESRGPQQSRMAGRVPVDVASGDVTNVHVRLTPPNEITGRLAPEKADSSLNLAQVRLNFTTSAGGGRGAQNQRVDIAADGKFQGQLSTDTYTVEVQGAPTGYYLKAVRLSGRDLPDNVLDLNFTGAQLDVVLANDSGSITGKVERSNGEAVQNARVTVIPANGSRRDLFKSANSAADGTFTISNVPPGSYKVFAWEEVEQNAWQDPDFRRPFETLGSNATIRDSAGPNLTLRVIGKEQMLDVQ